MPLGINCGAKTFFFTFGLDGRLWICILKTMSNLDQIKNTKGTYQSTITFIKENGWGESEYRVKVTFNNGENVSFFKSYDSLNKAIKSASRELNKIS